MSSVFSEPPRFYSDTVTREPLPNGPGEWREAWLAIPEDLGNWTEVRIWVQGRPAAVSRALADGVSQTLALWPRSGPGRHRIEAIGRESRWEASIEIVPRTIAPTAFAAMLEDLSHRLPASIALSLARSGANLPLNRTALDQLRLPEELERLRHTVLGWPDGTIGLTAVLESVAQSPITRLVREPEIRPVRRALRPDLTRLGPILGTMPSDSRGRPRRIVDMRPVESFDTVENRFIAHFARIVARRLRRLVGLAERVPALDAKEVGTLFGRLRHAARGLRDFDGLRPLAMPPSSQAMLRLAPYRRGLGTWRRFRQSLSATLEDRRLDAPTRNLPELYELWGTLSVISGALQAVSKAGWTIERQQLLGETPYGFGVRALPIGQAAFVACSPDGQRRLQYVPQAVAKQGGQPLASISHTMIPDVVILVYDGSELETVLIFDPKYKRYDDKPVDGDINKMHTYRDAIRDRRGRRVVTYAGIIYPGEGRDYSGEVGALPGVPGSTSPTGAAREKVLEAIDSASERPRAA